MKQRVINWWANPENREKVWKGMAWFAFLNFASFGIKTVASRFPPLWIQGSPNAALLADLTLTDIVTDPTNYSFLAIWVALYFCTGSPRLLPWRSPKPFSK